MFFVGMYNQGMGEYVKPGLERCGHPRGETPRKPTTLAIFHDNFKVFGVDDVISIWYYY